METKHTKGNWNLGGNTENGVLVSKTPPENRDIATVWKYDNDFLENEEMMANAKLIASAPELLEALQELLQVKEWKDKYGKDDQYLKAKPIVWRNAENAIKKALT